MTVITAPCQYCGRTVSRIDGRWVDLEATGDDSVWRETCDAHDTFTAEHEPIAERSAALGVGHVWTRTQCLAYRTLNPRDCNCRAAT